MRSVKLATVLIVLVLSGGLALVGGCDMNSDLKLRNRTQQQRISELESQLQASQLQLDQLKRKLASMEQTGGVEVDALRQRIVAMEEELTKKEELIKSMQSRLMGMNPLPAELNSALEDLARQHGNMIEYDPNHGLVKFKSDLLFEKGSDQVTSSAAEAIKALCGILNSDQAKDFHIIVAGHTDDIPIRRAQTQMQHPSNWYLSSHRAISVLNSLQNCGITPTRLSTRGFGEYRPVAPNAPNKGGNPKNRRVEVYIVPAGT
ncbi:MAG: OmpA family protein [Sedimentisphaerales bacterium]|nr:OmpA family protein [Sedimentisphaerales bacterium]